MVSYTLSSKAYLKIFFHIAKHPHRLVNGVLLGHEAKDTKSVVIVDTIPLLHHWTSLSPMMEIGLDLAGSHADSLGLKLVGYYQASERLDDTALVLVGEKVAGKIREGFKDAIAFVIDGQTILSGEPALIPYLCQASSSWRPFVGEKAAFTPGSLFTLVDCDIPTRAIVLVRDQHMHQKFGDFDDHLEDVTIDWLRNTDCIPSNI